MIGLFLTFTFPTLAFAKHETTIDGSVPTTNPFPRFISNEEVAAAQTFNASAAPGNKKTHLAKVFFTPLDGNEPREITDELKSSWTPDFADREPGTYDFYFVLLPERYMNTNTAWRWKLKAFDHQLNSTSTALIKDDTGHKLNNTSLSINNTPIQTTDPEGWEELLINNIQHPQYIHGSFRLDTIQDSNVLLITGITRSAPFPAITVQLNYQIKNQASADFHFVLDSEYRQGASLSLEAALPERNSGQDPFSFKAHSELSLSDLIPTKSFGPYIFGMDDRENAYYKTPLFSSQAALEELLKTKIPGYVYIDNDIDKPAGKSFDTTEATYAQPAGNHYYSVGMSADGTMLTKKHYYLTYRPFPSVVQITNLSAQDMKPVPGASFALYVIDADGKETLVADDLVTLEDGSITLAEKTTQTDATSMVKAAEGLKDNGIYLNDSGIYVPEGSYILKNTKASAGYKKAADVHFKVELPTTESLVVPVKVLSEAEAEPRAPHNDTRPQNSADNKHSEKSGKKNLPLTSDLSYPLVGIIATALTSIGAACLSSKREK
ncbi:MAG: hypothetical protein Q4B91_02130 [Atopobiaceae bacterium]|nr:hypothetical protein [Atopobiaceae bacterium]